MRSPDSILLTASAVILAMVAACASPPPQEPDLIPERLSGSQGPVGFCRRDDAGNLIVRVRNQTNEAVFVQTATEVTFPPGQPVSQSTPPMPGGSFADVTFAIPPGCFNPDCEFTIEVDADNQVDESHGAQPDNHEANNTANGICIG